MLPELITNWINGRETLAVDGGRFTKLRPTDGQPLCEVARSKRIK